MQEKSFADVMEEKRVLLHKSDIQPVIEIGGKGIYIPFHTVWQHEVTQEFDHQDIVRLDSFAEILPALL